MKMNSDDYAELHVFNLPYEVKDFIISELSDNNDNFYHLMRIVDFAMRTQKEKDRKEYDNQRIEYGSYM